MNLHLFFLFSDEINRLEQIVIEAFFQGQTKRAPIECRCGNGIFCPGHNDFRHLNWIIWLSLGLSGFLPTNTLKNTVGGCRTSFR